MEIKDLTLDDVDIYVNSSGKCRIVFSWSANIGFGEYSLYYDAKAKKWEGDSECIDRDDDKEFLKALLEKFAEKVEVKA